MQAAAVVRSEALWREDLGYHVSVSVVPGHGGGLGARTWPTAEHASRSANAEPAGVCVCFRPAQHALPTAAVCCLPMPGLAPAGPWGLRVGWGLL